jgi:hypothetical protein
MNKTPALVTRHWRILTLLPHAEAIMPKIIRVWVAPANNRAPRYPFRGDLGAWGLCTIQLRAYDAGLRS